MDEFRPNIYRMTDDAKIEFVKVLTMKDISTINRALGVIEGLTSAVQDPGVADGLVGAIERIEAVVGEVEEDG